MIKTNLHDVEIGEYFYSLEPLQDYKFANKREYVHYATNGDGELTRFRIGKCKRTTAYACIVQYLKSKDVTLDILIALGINNTKKDNNETFLPNSIQDNT